MLFTIITFCAHHHKATGVNFENWELLARTTQKVQSDTDRYETRHEIGLDFGILVLCNDDLKWNICSVYVIKANKTPGMTERNFF